MHDNGVIHGVRTLLRAGIQFTVFALAVSLSLQSAAAAPPAPPRLRPHNASPPSHAGITVHFNPPTCSFSVQPWPPEAQTAFEYAAGIWASYLMIWQPIVIDACWRSMNPNSLGGEFPFPTAHDFPNAPIPETLYPMALANQLAGSDLNGDDAEMRLELNSTASFYFGTDGNPASDQVDLVSVVLHEIAHGLGMGGSMDVQDGNGRWGRNGMPIIFDRFVVNRVGQHLIDIQLFRNPSPFLARQLTSGNVYFDGPLADIGNGGSPPKLYSPRIFSLGSSIVHLDGATFGASLDAVMTSGNEEGKVTHTLGPVLLGILQDLGWHLSPVEFECKGTLFSYDSVGDC